MTQTNHTFHMFALVSKPLLALAILVGAWQGAVIFRMPSARHIATPREQVARTVWPAQSIMPIDIDFAIFQQSRASVAHDVGALSGRFRLAGTFFEYGGASDTRKAVLDDKATGRQTIASENDHVDGIRVLRIQQTSVDLQDSEGNQERIWLSFTGKQVSRDALGQLKPGGPGGFAFAVSPESFQISQVGETSWVFQRETILEYYSELRDEPERLLNIFDSMKPERNETGDIEGYRLIVEGEPDFFQAAGLRENDIVRGVNSRKLTNRRIAEAYIADFISDKANAFVLDVERDGKIEQFVYQVR